MAAVPAPYGTAQQPYPPQQPYHPQQQHQHQHQHQQQYAPTPPQHFVPSHSPGPYQPQTSAPYQPPPAPSTAPAPSLVPGVDAKSVVQTGHSDAVHDVQLDYFGRRLATASSDRTVRIYDVTPGPPRLVATLEGHDGPVWQARWSACGTLLATASYDGRVIIWRAADASQPWRRIFEYSWHASSVNAVAFAPPEVAPLAFACASSDGFVSVCSQQPDGTWDERRISESTDGASHTHPLGALSVSWFPHTAPGSLFHNGDTAASNKDVPMMIATAGCDALVKIWAFDKQADQWKLADKPLRAHKDVVRSVSVAPSIGLPRSVLASASHDKKVCIWTKEVGSSNTAQQPAATEWVMTELPAFTAPVWAVSWSPTGSILAVTSGEDGVSLWKEELDGKWRNVSDVSGNAGAKDTLKQ